jgi:hypothetical protein
MMIGADSDQPGVQLLNESYKESMRPVQPKLDTSFMQHVVRQVRSNRHYTSQMLHHESVVNRSFDVKWACRRIDDASIIDASEFTDVGCLENIRCEMACNGSLGPVYRHIQMLIRRLREHLVSLGIRTKRAFILDWLSDDRWKSVVDTGTLKWADIYSMLKTSVRAIHFSVGSAEAVSLLYEDRMRGSYAGTHSVYAKNNFVRPQGRIVSRAPCSDMVRLFTDRNGSYADLYSTTASKALGSGGDNGFIVGKRGSVFDIFGESEDNPRLGLAPATYAKLVNKVASSAHADEVCTKRQLALLTLEMLIDIKETLSTFDVRLSNAEICVTRACSTKYNIGVEQKSFNVWFEKGLRTDNTLSWLRQEATRGVPSCLIQGLGLSHSSSADVHRIVFGGYVSLITGPDTQQLQEETYPELLLLDIAYIQEARSVFYGQVIQAAILVIVGTRMLDLYLPAHTISKCLDTISIHPSFTTIGRPDTCRASDTIIESLQSALRGVIESVVSDKSPTDSILREVAREASHIGYPSSPIASHLARKWATAMRMGVSIHIDRGYYNVAPIESMYESNLGEDNAPTSNLGEDDAPTSNLGEDDAPTSNLGEDDAPTDDDESTASDQSSEADVDKEWEHSYSETLHEAFACPENTRAAFCSLFLLPTAALCLSSDLQSSMDKLVARTWFNVAVHDERYKTLLSLV